MALREEEKICPLCGEDNHCKSGSKDCWCNNITIPKELIDTIPEGKKGIACICEKCVEKYIEENKTI